MKTAAAILTGLFVALLAIGAIGQDADGPAPAPVDEPQCLVCHGESDLWDGEDRKYFVTAKDLANDVHWQQGLRCHDCHGGDATSDDYGVAHSEDAGFRTLRDPRDVPGFCGSCHSDPQYMRRFGPRIRTDQEREYWTSGHGIHLKETGDTGVAHCISCHGHHGIRRVDDLASPVYPTRVAQTCATCHDDAERMEGREYEGRRIGHGQYADWKESVHGQAMLKKGDLGAPTCNDCHGNHGALPPEVGSVANACGTCHGKVADLFRNTQMKHGFERAGLPGCATCHGSHAIVSPTDDMLGMTEAAVCARCHEDGQFGATLAGAGVAREMRDRLEDLKARIAEAGERVADAERLGMEVREAKFDLHKAHDALVNARALIHAFKLEPIEEAVTAGRAITDRVTSQAEAAMQEHTARRIWLGVSLLLIVVVVVVLVRAIRSLPPPEPAADA